MIFAAYLFIAWILFILAFFCFFVVAKDLAFQGYIHNWKRITASFVVIILASWTMLLTSSILVVPFSSGMRVYTPDPMFVHYISDTHPALVEGISVVDFRERSSPVPLLPFVHGAAGSYFSLTKRVSIPAENVDREIWLHEMCHHVWFWKMKRVEQEEYTAIYDYNIARNKQNITSTFPTEYGMVDEEEDWADSCAGYILGFTLDDNRMEIISRTLSRITNCTEGPHCSYAHQMITIEYGDREDHLDQSVAHSSNYSAS